MSDTTGITRQNLEQRIARALMPPAFEGQRQWLAADPYVARHLAAHAVDAAILDELLVDPGFLAVAEPDQLIPLLNTMAKGKAGAIARVYWRALPLLREARPPDRASILQLTAELEEPEVARLLRTPLSSSVAIWADWSPTALHRVLQGHQDEVRAVAIGSIDKRPVIASGSRDGSVRLWDVGAAAPRAIMRGHRGWVTAVAIGEVDGRPIVVSGGQDGAARVWDAHTGQCTRASVGRAHPVSCIAIADGSSGPVVVVSRERTPLVTIWDARADKKRPSVDLQDWSPFSVFEQHEQVLTLGSVGGKPAIVFNRTANSLIVWSIEDKKPLNKIEGANARTAALGTIDGVPVVVTAGNSGAPSVWGSGGELIRSLGPRGVELKSLAIADSGQESVIIAAAWNRDTVICWDALTGKFLAELSGHTGQIRSLAARVVAGHLVVASGSDDHTVRMWDARNIRSVERTATGVKDQVVNLAADSHHGRSLVISKGITGRLTMRDGESGKSLRSVEGLTSSLRHLALGGPRHRPLIIDAKPYGPVRIWDASTLEPAKLLPRPRGLAAVAVGDVGDDPVLAVASRYRISIWRGWPLEQTAIAEMDAGWLARLLRIGQTTTVAVAEVGKSLALATGNSRAQVRLWDPRTGNQLALLQDGKIQQTMLMRGGVRRSVLAFGMFDDQAAVISVWSGAAAAWQARPDYQPLFTRIDADKDWMPVAIGGVGGRPAVACRHSTTGEIVVRDLWESHVLYHFPFPTSFPVVALDGEGRLVIGEERGLVAIDLAGGQRFHHGG
jgi:WD40 repeat protein